MSDSKGAAIEKIIQDIEDYCVVGALGGTPFNTQEENDKLREDAVDKGRTKAKQAILAILAQEVKQARIEELKKALEVSEEELYHGRAMAEENDDGSLNYGVEAKYFENRIKDLERLG